MLLHKNVYNKLGLCPFYVTGLPVLYLIKPAYLSEVTLLTSTATELTQRLQNNSVGGTFSICCILSATQPVYKYLRH